MASLKQTLAVRPPRRITVIRTDRVGDLILSTPFLTVLRCGFPEAVITALVDPYCREVLEESGLVDSIVTTLPSAGPESVCDLAIALAPRTASLRAAYKTGAALRLGYVYRDRPLVRLAARCLLTHFEEVTVRPPLQVPHEVEQLDLLARRLGLPPSTELGLRLGIASEKVPGRVVFHLGDRWLAGGWSLGDVHAIISGLGAFREVKVTAGPRERALLSKSGFCLEQAELCADLSFRQWAELLGSAQVLVSPDTGAVHLAAAMGTSVVVAYEAATYDHCSRQWAPWRVANRSVVKGPAEETIPSLLAAVEELVSDSRNGAT